MGGRCVRSWVGFPGISLVFPSGCRGGLSARECRAVWGRRRAVQSAPWRPVWWFAQPFRGVTASLVSTVSAPIGAGVGGIVGDVADMNTITTVSVMVIDQVDVAHADVVAAGHGQRHVVGQDGGHQTGVSDRQCQLRTASSFPLALGAVLGVVSVVASLAECRQVEQAAGLRTLVVHVGHCQDHHGAGVFPQGVVVDPAPFTPVPSTVEPDEPRAQGPVLRLTLLHFLAYGHPGPPLGNLSQRPVQRQNR